MALKFELTIKKDKSVEDLKYELKLILLLFKAMPLIKSSSAMSLIANYDDAKKGSKIEIIFTKFNYVPNTDQEKNKFKDLFKGTVNNVLIELNLIDDYEHINCIPGFSYSEEEPFKKNSIAITAGNETLSKKELEDSKEGVAKLTSAKPSSGFIIILCNNFKKGTYNNFKLTSDSQRLVKILNDKPISIRFVDVNLILKPVILVGINRQAFTLAVPSINSSSEENLEVIRNCFSEIFKEEGFLNDYFISASGTTADIFNVLGDKATTKNGAILDALEITEAPKDFYCDLSGLVMDDPIQPPETNCFVDKKMFLISYAESPENPFNRQIVQSTDKISVDLIKKHAIEDFVATNVENYFLKHQPIIKNFSSPYNFNSPVSLAGEANDKLLKEVAPIIAKNKPNFDGFATSITENKYEQALRRACTAKPHDDAFSLVKALLKYKEQLSMDINAKGEKSRAAIHYAGKSGNEDIYNFLKNVHKVADWIDDDGFTAEQYLEQSKTKQSNATITKDIAHN